MVDRQISAGCVLAYGLWALALVVWLASYLAQDPGLGHLAIIIMGAGATATVRTYFIDLGKRIKTALAVVEQSRPEAVRPLR